MVTGSNTKLSISKNAYAATNWKDWERSLVDVTEKDKSGKIESDKLINEFIQPYLDDFVLDPVDLWKISISSSNSDNQVIDLYLEYFYRIDIKVTATIFILNLDGPKQKYSDLRTKKVEKDMSLLLYLNEDQELDVMSMFRGHNSHIMYFAKINDKTLITGFSDVHSFEITNIDKISEVSIPKGKIIYGHYTLY